MKENDGSDSSFGHKTTMIMTHSSEIFQRQHVHQNLDKRAKEGEYNDGTLTRNKTKEPKKKSTLMAHSPETRQRSQRRRVH